MYESPEERGGITLDRAHLMYSSRSPDSRTCGSMEAAVPASEAELVSGRCGPLSLHGRTPQRCCGGSGDGGSDGKDVHQGGRGEYPQAPPDPAAPSFQR